MYILSFVFYKKGILRYISHLDLIRLFARAARRAGFSLYLTRGFSPHPKIITKRAMKLGLESESEEARICLNSPLEAEEFIDRFNAELPESVKVVAVSGVIERCSE